MIMLAANTQVYKGYVVSISLDTIRRVELTDWNNYESVSLAIGIATNDANIGEMVNIQTDGIYENIAWNFIHKKPVYVFASGTLTQDLPTKNVKRIGFAISDHELLIMPSEFIMVNL